MAQSPQRRQQERRRNRKQLSGLDQEFLNLLRERFRGHAGGRRMSVAQVGRFLGIRNRYLSRRLVAALDEDGDGRISEGELLKSVAGLILGSDEEKLRFVFRLHDAAGDGALDREELERMMAACLEHNRLRVSAEDRKALAAAVVKKGGDRKGRLDFSAFRRLLAGAPLVRRQMLQNVAEWFGAGGERPLDVRHRRFSTVVRQLLVVVPYYLWRALLIAAYIGANAYLFAAAVGRYAEAGANIYIQIARGAGACLKLNGMLILLPMMRTFLTWVRKSFLAVLLPVDQNVDIHMMVGNVMFLFALLHSGAHLMNYSTLAAPVAQSLLHTGAGLSGLILLAVFTVMWLFAQQEVRRTRLYGLFALSHLLYWAWFALTLIHGPAFLPWAAVPVAGFAAELLVRRLRKRQLTFVKEAVAHATGVTELKLHRPPGFRFRAGEYLFLRIPRISRFGWHPFTISSNPEAAGHIRLHVRVLGNWTRRLHRYFTSPRGGDGQVPAEVHGPYGSPSARIFSSRYAVLIGAGIGVTPFASILESVAHRAEHRREMRLEKVYFFWLYRGQQTFAWFSELLAELERRPLRSLLETNIYLTDARINATTGLVKVGMDLLHRQTRRDVLTGLSTRTNFGRPDWDQIFYRISAAHPYSRVNVFFCGPYPLGRIVRGASRRAGFHFRMEQF